MGYSVVALKNKIMEMYPEIEENGVQMGLVFNGEKDTYFVSFRKGRNVFATHLQKTEADAFMDGIRFVFLGSQIGRWLKNFTANKIQAKDMHAVQGTRQQEPDHGHYRRFGCEKEGLWAIQLSH